MLTAILLGLALGLRHASDPDHVVAVSTIVTRSRSPWTASWIGVAWGIGHGLTILTVGAGVIALRIPIPQTLALSMEFAVGLVLVALGVTNLLWARQGPQVPRDPSLGPACSATPLAPALARAFGVGLVHGLAGSAAVALLALAAMPTAAAAVAYLAVFGLGTIGGMVAISLGLGVPLVLAGEVPGLRRWIVAGSGALSLAVGLSLVVEIGWMQGLL